MRITLSITCFFYAFFCSGMNYPAQNTDPANNQNQALVQQNLSYSQQLCLKSIGCSVRIINEIIKNLPKKHQIPLSEEHERQYSTLNLSLDALTNSLEASYLNGLALQVAPLYFQENGVTYPFYPISIAIDFSHIPLLIACKKHFIPSNQFPNASCVEEGKGATTSQKYLNKLQKISSYCIDSLKNGADQKTISYFVDEFAKLSRILKIITIPTCYE